MMPSQMLFIWRQFTTEVMLMYPSDSNALKIVDLRFTLNSEIKRMRDCSWESVAPQQHVLKQNEIVETANMQ